MKRSRYFGLLQLSIVLLYAQVFGQSTTTTSSPLLQKARQGVTSTGQPTYFSLSGFNGLQLQLSLPSQSRYDYTIMFWFRSHLSKDDLIKDSVNKHFLFELDGSVSCYIEKGLNFGCSPSIKPTNNTSIPTTPIQLALIPDIQQWMHLTYTARAQANYSTLRIDYPGASLQMTVGYSSVSKNIAHLGIDSGLTTGFNGDVREFFMSYGAIANDKIPYLINIVKVFDVSTMAYYRFQTENGIFQDWFRSQTAKGVVAIVPNKQGTDQASKDQTLLRTQPSFKIEAATNPFCNTLESQFATVAKFENYSSGRVPIANIQYDQFSFGYTLSMWVKNSGATNFSTNPRQGLLSASFITFEGQFALWFDSQSSFRVFVFSKDNFDTSTSDSVLLPLNQWVNVQININFGSGITVMTFNTNGERQQLVTNPGYLQKQNPAPFMNIFQNFNGYVLDFKFWYQPQIQIPYQTANVDGTPDLLSQVAIYYNFNSTNYNGNGFIPLGNTGKPVDTTVPSNTTSNITNIFANPATGAGQPTLLAAKNSGWHFEKILVPIPEKVNYQYPSTLGQMYANSTLYDGMSCPDPTNNQFLLNGNSASLILSVLNPKTNQFTVEFWFRFPQGASQTLPSPNYLFTMGLRAQNSLSQTSEAMTIYIDTDGLLKCAPFGRSAASETILVYQGVNPYQNSWQHVSCIYDRDEAVTGQYLAFNSDSIIGSDINIGTRKALLPQTFSVSLANQSIRILNYVQATTIQVVLGNNAAATQPQNCYFKDLRVWVTKRNTFDMFSNRFKQVKNSPDLIVNFKFINGNPVFSNDADASGQQATVVGGSYVPSDGQNIVCNVDRYFVPSTGQCTTFPFSPAIPVIYSVTNSEQHGHYMLLTSNYAISPLTLPGTDQPQIQTQWRSSDAQTNKLIKSPYASVIQFDPNYMIDGSSYPFSLLATDPSGHNFWQNVNQSFFPRKCFYVVDVNSNEPFNQVNYVRRPVQTAQPVTNSTAINAASATVQQQALAQQVPTNLCFTFQVKQVDGCSDNYYDQLQSNITIQTQPKIPVSILSKAVTGFDISKQKFQVCFDQATLNSNDFPVNIPINFILGVQWTKSASSASSQMSLVYQLTNSEPIYANITASASVVDVSQTLIFDARKSVFNETGLNAGLVYSWQCPDKFQSYCDDWFDSPVLEITSSAFISFQGKILTPYQFQLNLWSIQAGRNPQPSQIFSSAVTVTWKSLQAPKFNLIATMSPTQSSPSIYVTKSNQIQIQLLNYRGTDSLLIYSWTLTPANAYNATLTHVSADKTVFTIDPSALRFSTIYSLKVDIKNDQPYGQTSTQYLNFTTGVAPAGGSVVITPSEGNMFTTNFTISLSGYTSANQPLFYSLWGITSQNPPSSIRLTPGLQPLDATGSATLSMNLPIISGIQAQITDAFGEIVFSTSTVKVGQTPNFNFTNVTATLSNSTNSSYPLQQLNQATFLAYQANQDAAQNIAQINSTIAVNLQIINLLSNVVNRTNLDVNPQSRQSMSLISNALTQLTQNNQTIDISVVENSASVMENMMAKQNPFQDAVNNDPEFVKNYAQAIGNLIAYSTINADQLLNAQILADNSPPPKKRLLQTQNSTQVSTIKGFTGTDGTTNTTNSQSKTLNQTVQTPIKISNTTRTPQPSSQQINNFRSQIRRLIVLKNRFLDNMCQSITLNSQEIRFNTPKLELIASKISADLSNPVLDQQFVYSVDQTAISVPTDELIRHTLDLNSTAKQVCIQVSFMQSYPLGGYQFLGQYQGGKVYTQTSSLDDLGNRIMSTDSGITGLILKPFQIEFPYDFPANGTFVKNQTVCMTFNGNLEVLGDAQWQTQECQTVINKNVKPGQQGTIQCQCSSMSNHYVGLITDKERLPIIVVPHSYTIELRFLVILLPLLWLGIFCPCIVTSFDKNELKRLEEDHFEKLNDDFVEQFQLKRQIKCREEVLYKLPQIEHYMNMQETDFRVGSCTALTHYTKTMHPILNLWFKYDFFNKRLFRLTVVIWQVSWITIFCVACFLKSADNLPEFIKLGSMRLYAIGFLFGLLTLPPPGCFFDAMKLNVDKIEVLSPKPNKTDEENQQEETEDGKKQEFIILNDSYMYLKMIFILVTYIVYFAALLLIGVLIVFSRTNNNTLGNLVSAANLNLFNMSKQQVNNLIGTWYLAVLGFGWTAINGIRVFIIAQMAPVQAREMTHQALHPNKNEEQKQACGLCCCICTFIGYIWCIIAWPFKMLWKLIFCIAQCCHTRMSCCCNCSILIYLDKYTWRTFIFIPIESVEIGADILTTIHVLKRQRQGFTGKDQDEDMVNALNKSKKPNIQNNNGYGSENEQNDNGYSDESAHIDVEPPQKKSKGPRGRDNISSPDLYEEEQEKDKANKKSKNKKKKKDKTKKSKNKREKKDRSE